MNKEFFVSDEITQKISKFDSIIFDCDGVLVDIRNSYDEAINKTISAIMKELFDDNIDNIVSSKIHFGLKSVGGFNDEVAVVYAIIMTLVASKQSNIPFDKLIIDLGDLNTTTIKTPKLQETSTVSLLSCFIKKNSEKEICKTENKEVIPTLNRRIIVPFYIPALTIICSLLLLREKKFYLNKISIFLYSFVILLFTELALRYTGLSNFMKISFIILPFIIISLTYTFLLFKLSNKTSSQ